MTTRIILDTDIGNDIDDAVCLAYLLMQPECDLVGITTVTGQPTRRAEMASAICRTVDRDDIPILAGASVPMVIESRQSTAPQADRLGDWPRDTDYTPGQAVAWMQRTIRDNPGDIVLLTIGPLTNVGALFAADPEIPSLLKGLVMMLGVVECGLPRPSYIEWNARCDPHAAAVVYRHRCAVHRSVGLDVTRRVRMGRDEVLDRFTAPVLAPVRDFSEVWFETRDIITFHDPLAAATVFDDVCTFARGTVDIELASPPLLGMTRFNADPAGPHEMAETVDAERFFNHYFSIVTG
ncbi:MAG: nucleoside hydrolase [Planctomycetota bacterium]